MELEVIEVIEFELKIEIIIFTLTPLHPYTNSITSSSIFNYRISITVPFLVSSCRGCPAVVYLIIHV